MSERFKVIPSTAHRNGTMQIRDEAGSNIVMVMDGVTADELRQLAAACLHAADTFAPEHCASCGAPRNNHPYRHPFKTEQRKEGQR